MISCKEQELAKTDKRASVSAVHRRFLRSSRGKREFPTSTIENAASSDLDENLGDQINANTQPV